MNSLMNSEQVMAFLNPILKSLTDETRKEVIQNLNQEKNQKKTEKIENQKKIEKIENQNKNEEVTDDYEIVDEEEWKVDEEEWKVDEEEIPQEEEKYPEEEVKYPEEEVKYPEEEVKYPEEEEDKELRFKNMTRQWLKDETSIMDRVDFSQPPSPKQKFTLIKGAVQSGKTKAMLCCALEYLLQGHSAVMVVRNLIGDYKQLENHVNSTCKGFAYRHLDYCQRKGVGAGTTITVTYVGDDDEGEILKAINGEEPRLIVCLANGTQLKRFNNYIRQVENPKYLLLVDEVDSLGYSAGSDAEEENKRKSNENGKKFYTPEFARLFKQAERIIGVTATAFAVLFREAALMNRNIWTLKTPANYRGIHSIDVKEFEHNPKIPGYSHKSILEADPNTLEFYRKLGEQEPFRLFMQNRTHPIISLHKVSALTAHHKEIMEGFIQDPELKDNWAVIIYNGTGIHLYHHTLKNKKITIDKVKSAPSDSQVGRGVHEFRGIGIQSCLQYLYDNGGTERFGHIVIISGHLAARGINFVSSNFEWHLTHEYLLMSRSSDAADLIQAIRLCGIYEDSIRLTLYTTPTLANDLRNAEIVQSEIIKQSVDHENEYTRDFYKKVPIKKSNIPKKVLTKKMKNPQLNVFDDKKKQKEKNLSERCGIVYKHYISGAVMKKTYKIAIEAVLNLVNSGVWVRRARVIEKIQKQHKDFKYDSYLKANLMQIARKRKACAETVTKGLLFRKVDNEWELRVNEW